MTDAVAVAILAKAPLLGLAKTRLVCVLGAQGAASLQARLIERAAHTACCAAVGPVTLWAAPHESHPVFARIHRRHGLTLKRQREEEDLGARMLRAIAAADGPALVIGTDCPALTPRHLRTAASALTEGSEVVLIPAEDGGYVLIGMRSPQPAIFSPMGWGSARVLGETRRRLQRCGLRWRESDMLWDVDRPDDIERLRASGLHELLS